MIKRLKDMLKGLSIVVRRNPSLILTKIVLPVGVLIFTYYVISPFFSMVVACVNVALSGIFEALVVSSHKLFKQITGYTPDELMSVTVNQALNRAKDELGSPLKNKVKPKNNKKDKSSKIINLAETLKDSKLQ